MTQPYPAAPPQQPYAPQQPQYPAQPPAPQQYAPPQEGYPQYSAQIQAAPQGYAPNPYAHPQTAQNYPGPQGYPYGPPQQPQYAPQQAPAPAGPPPVQASLGDFYSQPTVGWGPCVTPNGKAPDGTQVLFVVAQHITQAHIEQADEYQKEGVPAFYRNGKPKLVMKIPGYVAPGTTYTTGQGAVQTIADGRAQYFVQGGDKDLLAVAIAAAGGNAAEPPELGSLIRVTKTHSRPNRSGTMSAVRTFEYWRPGPETAGIAAQLQIQYPDITAPRPAEPAPAAAAPASAPQAPPAAPAAPQGIDFSAPQFQQPATPAAPPAPPVSISEMQAATLAPVPQAPAPQQFAPPAAPPAVNVAGLDAERQALLAQLTGQPAPVG